MIEDLKGIFETVNFKQDTKVKLYVNDEAESYPPHWHSPMEIIMPLESIYTVECGGTTFTLQEGHIIFIFPCNMHTLTAPNKGKRIIFQPDVHILHHIKEVEAILSLMSPVMLITPETAPTIYDTIRLLLLEITEEYRNSSPLSEAVIYSKLLTMLVLMGRNYTENIVDFDVTPDKRQEYTEKFVTICDYISSHCTEELNLEQLSEMAGFSKFHFSRLFKQFSGQSFYQYVSQKRIEHAEILLASGEKSITDVAADSGFESMSAFIRMFKLQKGMTPTQFRKMYSRNSQSPYARFQSAKHANNSSLNFGANLNNKQQPHKV